MVIEPEDGAPTVGPDTVSVSVASASTAGA